MKLDTKLVLPTTTYPIQKQQPSLFLQIVQFIKAKPKILWLLLLLRTAKLGWDFYLNYRQISLMLSLTKQPTLQAARFVMVELNVVETFQYQSYWSNNYHLLLEAIVIWAAVVSNFVPWVWNMLGICICRVKMLFAYLFCCCAPGENEEKSDCPEVGEIEHTVVLLILLNSYTLLLPLFEFNLNGVTSAFFAFIVLTVGAWQFATTIFIVRKGEIAMKWLYICNDVVAPPFSIRYKFPDCPLRKEIDNFAQKVGFPLDNIYFTPELNRNAYAAGVRLSERIVFTAGLIGYTLHQSWDDGESPIVYIGNETEQELNQQEILAVFGHEMGHWNLNHVLHRLIFDAFNTTVLVSLVAMFYKSETLFLAFGFRKQRPLIIAVGIVVFFIAVPYTEVMNLLLNWFKQRDEYAADAFSAKFGYARHLCSGLTKLHVGDPMPDIDPSTLWPNAAILLSLNGALLCKRSFDLRICDRL
uniref:Peptidase M48 domain-containing protein n=1 Tax=Ditylenchus dipsaci TaxID=166011 RepID=A0A915CZP8_9BILA